MSPIAFEPFQKPPPDAKSTGFDSAHKRLLLGLRNSLHPPPSAGERLFDDGDATRSTIAHDTTHDSRLATRDSTHSFLLRVRRLCARQLTASMPSRR